MPNGGNDEVTDDDDEEEEAEVILNTQNERDKEAGMVWLPATKMFISSLWFSIH